MELLEASIALQYNTLDCSRNNHSCIFSANPLIVKVKTISMKVVNVGQFSGCLLVLVIEAFKKTWIIS